MWISRYFVLFIIFSVCGWVYETIYCSVKDGYWQNRGFLFGPLCPIYGFGAASVTAIAEAISKSVASQITWWEIFLIGVIGSIFLEYGTSWVLEKIFHAVWWDYSDMPLNLHGRICAPASFLFGVMAVVIYYVVFPWTLWVKAVIPPIVMEAMGLVLMGLFAMDATLTVSALSDFANAVRSMSENANQNMESLTKAIQEKAQQAGEFIGEIKTVLATDHAKRLAGNMAHLHKSAINRVSGFRYPKPTIPYVDRLKEEIGKRRLRIGIFSPGKPQDKDDGSKGKRQ